MTCDPIVTEGQSRKKEFQRKVLPIQIFIYGVFTPLVLFAHPPRNSVTAYVLAVTLSVTMVGTIILLGFMVARQKDEFQRLLLMQATLWGICGTLSILTVWGLLEYFTDVHRVPALACFPIFLTITGVAKVLLFRSNRPADE